MFEVVEENRSNAPASAVWARWVKPERWPEWDPRLRSAAAKETLAEGVEVRVRMKRGGTVRQRVTAFEDGSRLVTEYSLPGARVGHEHLVEARGPGCSVTHRLYVDGPMSWLWTMMLGRRKLREAAAGFTDAG